MHVGFFAAPLPSQRLMAPRFGQNLTHANFEALVARVRTEGKPDRSPNRPGWSSLNLSYGGRRFKLSVPPGDAPSRLRLWWEGARTFPHKGEVWVDMDANTPEAERVQVAPSSARRPDQYLEIANPALHHFAKGKSPVYHQKQPQAVPA